LAQADTAAAHTDYSMQYHVDYLRKLTGLEPTDPRFSARWHDLWGMDLIWCTDDGLFKFDRGRQTDMGHAAYDADGSDQRQPVYCPFKDEHAVWAFDAIREYGLPRWPASGSAGRDSR